MGGGAWTYSPCHVLPAGAAAAAPGGLSRTCSPSQMQSLGAAAAGGVCCGTSGGGGDIGGGVTFVQVTRSLSVPLLPVPR